MTHEQHKDQKRRRRAGELYHEVLAAPPPLPALFVFFGVCRMPGYTSDRGSLHRTLQELKGFGYIAVRSTNPGTQRTQYRGVFARENESGT